MLISVQGIHYILEMHQYRSKQNHFRVFNLAGCHRQFSAQTLALRTCMPCITIWNTVEITMALVKLANQFNSASDALTLQIASFGFMLDSLHWSSRTSLDT
jgi:hypothetical protein